MLRPLLLFPLLLLAGTAAAQPLLPRDQDGHMVYSGVGSLPCLTQAQVLTQAMRFAQRHLMLEGRVQYYSLLVDSAAYLVSARASYPGQLPLRYELVLRAEDGACTYELSDLATEHSTMSSAVIPGASLRRPAARYELVEAVLDERSNYDAQRRPRPQLRAYCATVAREVSQVQAQLRTELAGPK